MMLKRLCLCLPAAFVLTACPAKVASVDVLPSKVSFDSEAANRNLSVTLKNADGAAIDGQKPTTWTSKDPAVAMIGPDGIVKPVGTGSTTITATVDEVSGIAAVEVLFLKRIQLQTPAMVVLAGVPTDPLVLNYMNERGEPVVMDAAATAKWPSAWKTADAAVATVDSRGVVTGVAAGSTTLHVVVNELKAEMSITVNPSPDAVIVPIVLEPTKKP